MKKLKLVFPTIGLKDEWLSYNEEYRQNNPKAIHMGFRHGMSYEKWLQRIIDDTNHKTMPSFLLFMVDDDNRIYGSISIRKNLNKFYSSIGGNIGYGIRPSERNKGYGKYILKLGLEECKKMGMDKVLVICVKSNTSSAKVIEANGGVLENEVYYEPEHNYMLRYWINL